MKQLRLTTTPPHSMFSDADKPLVIPEDLGEIIPGSVRGDRAYLHGEIEQIAKFDIAVFLDGDVKQLDEPIDTQDILVMLPDGNYPCIAALQEEHEPGAYYITLKNTDAPV